MTKREDTSDAAFARAAFAWARKLDAANAEFAAELEALGGDPGSEPPEDWKSIRSLAQLLASTVAAGCHPAGEPYGWGSSLTGRAARNMRKPQRFELGEHDRAVLQRLAAATRPAVDARTNAEAIELAHRIIDSFGRQRPTPDGELDDLVPFARRRQSHAMNLAQALAGRVHPAFLTLLRYLQPKDEPEDGCLVGLLDRYSKNAGGRGGRRRGVKSTLSARAILQKLNEMAGEPLGPLSMKAISEALRRQRTK